MEPSTALGRRLVARLSCGPLSEGLRDAAADSLARGAEEVGRLLDDATLRDLSRVLHHGRVSLAVTVEEMGFAHGRLRSAYGSPFPAHAVPARGSDDPLAELRTGEEVPDLYLWLWEPLLSGGPAAADFFARSARAAREQGGREGAARAMAAALLGPASWLWSGGPEGDRRLRDAVTEACLPWFSGGRADTGLFVRRLAETTEGFRTRAWAHRRAAEAWMRLRNAAWRQGAESGSPPGTGCPRKEALRFREAWKEWEALAGDDAEAAFLALLLRPVLGSTGGHAYLGWEAPDRRGLPSSVDLLLAPHEGFSLSRGLAGLDYALRRLLAHELGHLVWRCVLAPERQEAYTVAWAATEELPSTYAAESAEEGFCEHLSARLARSWGEGYVARRKDEVLASRGDAAAKAAALESLGALARFGPAARGTLEAAAGCFR